MVQDIDRAALFRVTLNGEAGPENAFIGKYLDTMVAGVSNIYTIIFCYVYTHGIIKLTGFVAPAAEAEQEFPLQIVDHDAMVTAIDDVDLVFMNGDVAGQL